jgi:hypothetical protein
VANLLSNLATIHAADILRETPEERA